MMDVPDSFFIPDVPSERYEEIYASLAHQHGIPVPPPAQRVYSIEFEHDGIIWTATVGKAMTGRGSRTVRRAGRKGSEPYEHSGPAKILAILTATPYVIYYDGTRSAGWENPFRAGDPRSITYFAGPPSRE